MEAETNPTETISTEKEPSQEDTEVKTPPVEINGNKESIATEVKSVDSAMEEEAPPKESTIESSEKVPENENSVENADEKEPQKEDLIPPLPEDDKSEKVDAPGDFSLSELNLPPVQTLGKGKRARIPNKRYSDILLSPQRTSKVTFENGEKYEKVESESELSHLEEVKEDIASMKSRSSTSSPVIKRTKSGIDLSNLNFRKPFLYGWKREMVYRANSSTNKSVKRDGEVYYVTPQGKKLRSMREISENLMDKELNVEDFTFYKEPLGIDDPEKEIIREAKMFSKVAKGKGGKVASPKGGSKTATPKNVSPMGSPAGSNTPTPNTRTRVSLRGLGNIKVKLPPKRGDKRKPDDDKDESPAPKRTAVKKGSSKAVAAKRIESPVPNKRTIKSNSISSTSEKNEESKSMENYLQNLSYGYNTLLYVFQYLKVQDLLRAGCVCTMWRDISRHASLWHTVRMKNSQVHSFEGLANSLAKHGTVNLDLRKMLLPNGGDDIWPEFSKAIAKVQTLRKIELCRSPASVVEQLAVTNTELKVINAVTIKCESINLDMLSNLTNLEELRLKSTSGLTLSSDITSLKALSELKHLCLTSVKDLHSKDLTTIGELNNLQALDLGECTDFPSSFGETILRKLPNLERLRLEKGQGDCHVFEILDAVKEMPKLDQLELVNFDIKAGFDLAMGACSNIKKLLIIPTYISQSATTNHMVLGGVLRLRSTLSHFVWGVTLELLRVTELFVDQCEDSEKKEKKEKKTGTGDSIPVLKPVPIVSEAEEGIPPAHDPPQVEILPLPNLQKLLLQSLPTTRVKILKIPFHATWRQSITDTVN